MDWTAKRSGKEKSDDEKGKDNREKLGKVRGREKTPFKKRDGERGLK